MSTPTVGYIGLDHPHRELFVRTLDQLPVEITCASEWNPDFEDEAFADDRDVAVYSDPLELLESEDVDIAWISTSTREMPTIARAAVEHDIDVYAEKPMARAASDIRPLLDELDDADSTVTVSYGNRARPTYQALRDRAASGYFGSIRAFDIRMIASKVEYRLSNPGRYIYDQQESRGGILQWLGCHYVDLVQWITDEPIVRVNVQMTFDSNEVDVEDGATLQFETESGARGSLVCGYYLGDGDYDIDVNIYGTEGRANFPRTSADVADDQQVIHFATTDQGSVLRRHSSRFEQDETPGYLGQAGLDFVEQFLSARDGRAPNPAGVEDAYRVLRVLDAAYASHERDGWVTVNR